MEASSRWARRGLYRCLIQVALVTTLWGGFFLALVLGYFAINLPSIHDFDQASRRPLVIFKASNGTRLASYGDFYGKTLEVSSVPPHLTQAIVAIEDHRFYTHFGLDLIGIARAMWHNVRAGGLVEGGSSLTQQLAKNLFLSPERSVKRKIQEALLALYLEKIFTKDEILSIYLNRVYLGTGAYGFDAAAQTYFGKSAGNLSLYESAILAGLLKAPSRLNPQASQKRAEKRAKLVLDAMRRQGFISRQEVKEALQSKPNYTREKVSQVRYFTDWVQGRLEGLIGPYRGDLVVSTTLDLRAQHIVERHLADQLQISAKINRVTQGGAVVLTPSGSVVALVGGRDYGQSQYNRVTQAMRQPGSAFKPFVYLAGLEQGIHPDHHFQDKPISVEGWKPKNYHNKYYGEVTLREAYARSSNSVAVQVLQRAGAEEVRDVARRLSLDARLDPTPALALGTSEITLLDLAGAYAPFANGGYWAQPYAITKVTDGTGKVLYERQQRQGHRVMLPEHNAMMNDLMVATIDWGTGKAAKIDRPFAGKTGTTQDSRDALFVGYTPRYVVGVWFGNDDNTPMKGVTGGTLPARVAGRIVRDLEYGMQALALNTAVASEIETISEEFFEGVSGFGHAIGSVLSNIFGRANIFGEDTQGGASQPVR